MSTIIPSIDKQEAYWDWWQDTRSINKAALIRADKILNMLRSLKIENPRILDYGCGNGWFTVKLAQFGDVTGIDLSKKHITKAQQESPHIKFIAADLFNHSFDNNSFDIVVSQQVISHVSNINEYLNLVFKILKNNGYLIVSANNKLVMERLGDKSHDHKIIGHIENWLTMRELLNLIKPHFKIIEKASILKRGNRGFFRIFNSYKLNTLANRLLGEERIQNLKNKLGLGLYNIVLAQKRS